MKRIFLEWGLIFSISAAVALLSLWIFSRYFAVHPYYLELGTIHTGTGIDHIYLVVMDGNLCIANDVYIDAQGNAQSVAVPRPPNPAGCSGEIASDELQFPVLMSGITTPRRGITGRLGGRGRPRFLC
jgi:hypothetical protein